MRCRASCRDTTIKLPWTWVEAAIMAQEECDAAACWPVRPSDGTKGLFCFIVKMQCLLLKYDRELKGAL